MPHQAPGSILNGTTVVGTADVGVTGDFAAVFDTPLPAGDYQLTLRAVGEDGVAKTSQEVATVSVPKDATGQLLAMVSKPGEASRLLTTPDALASATQTPASQPAAATLADVASATPQPTNDASANTAKPNGAAGLQVTAVEIEGAKMFVAGSAKPGALVRIYADDKLLGEMKADDKGHFVVDGQIELSVGSHIIRADMLSEDASKVVMRASVPFDRPAGAQVAAVAGPVSAAATAGLDGLRAEAGKALALLKGLFANGKVPTGEQLAAARSASEFALKSLADFRLTDNSDQALADEVARTAKAAADALAVLKDAPQDASMSQRRSARSRHRSVPSSPSAAAQRRRQPSRLSQPCRARSPRLPVRRRSRVREARLLMTSPLLSLRWLPRKARPSRKRWSRLR